LQKSFSCRVGLAQISVNPAYTDELVSYIQEPAFPEEHDKTGLFSISGLDEIGQFQNSVAEKYVVHLCRRIESIVRFASNDATLLALRITRRSRSLMELNDETKQLLRELGRAINNAVAESRPIAEVVSKASAAGLEFRLSLDGTVRVTRPTFPKDRARILESLHLAVSFEAPAES
jgi:hypothetical protein